MSSHRQERVESLIQRLISEMLVSGEIKDPRVDSLVSITSVSVAKDLSFAKILVSGYLDEKKIFRAVEGLNSAAGFIQAKLAKGLKTRLTPRVHFEFDASVKIGFEMSQQIDSIIRKDEEKRNPPSQ